MDYELNYDLTFKDLQRDSTLKFLDEKFLSFLKSTNYEMYEYLINQRKEHVQFKETYNNNCYVENIALVLEDFLLDLFKIKDNYNHLQTSLKKDSKIFLFRKLFVNKYVKTIPKDDLTQYDFNHMAKEIFSILNINKFDEDIFIDYVLNQLIKNDNHKDIELFTIFSAFLFNLQSKNTIGVSDLLFFRAKKTDFNNLCNIMKSTFDATITKEATISRVDFNLYNSISPKESLHNSNYCVKCHTRGNDTCRVGIINKQTNEYMNNPLDQSLTGCPIGMHISQMHTLKESHNYLAALGVITINNPLLPALGNNICNDCTTSCIYQKQEPVNTPLVETEILQQVLNLPLGFEIYHLLTRWNPLRFYRPYPKKTTNKNILIVGCGPSGYALSYSLHNEGHNIIMIDSLNISPITAHMDIYSPIFDINTITENMDDRVILGFGGVGEYGITTRWNKNFLKIIAILIYRQKRCAIHGGISLNSSLSLQEANEIGFDHVAICSGAGKPIVPDLNNNLTNGIKTASDFLMSLHLGAFKKDNLFNLQIQLPLVVLGGGLTAIDCATEACVYYIRQLEKHITRYHELCAVYGTNMVNSHFSQNELEVLREFVSHYDQIKALIDASQQNLIPDLLKSFGGIKIIYHKDFNQSKAYKTNHKEVSNALNHGVEFLDNLQLIKINKNNNNHLQSLTFKNKNQEITINAKTMIIAVGTEHSNILSDYQLQYMETKNNAKKMQYKQTPFSVIKGYYKNLSISTFGDAHELFKGSVVKAMASAFYGQYEINQILEKSNINTTYEKIKKIFNTMSQSEIISNTLLNKYTTQIKIKSKYMSETYKEGTFYKIHPKIDNQTIKKNTILYNEPLVLGVMKNDTKKKEITSLILHKGSSSRYVSSLQPKTKINITHNLGASTQIDSNRNILFIGGGIASYSMMPIIKKSHGLNNKIMVMNGYKKQNDVFYKHMFKKYSHGLIISIEEEAKFKTKNHIYGNLIDGLEYYLHSGNNYPFAMENVDSIIISGSSAMMNAIKNYLANIHTLKGKNIICSTHSPMNCTTKGLCGACIQKHNIDENNNRYIYTCANQEQNILTLDFDTLNARLNQNTIQEKISNLWFTYLENIT